MGLPPIAQGPSFERWSELIGHPATKLLRDSDQHVRDCLESLSAWLAEQAACHVLLVYDPGALAASGLEETLGESLKKASVTPFSEFSSSPTTEQTAQAARTARQSNATVVIALGGGSCLDVAKIAAAKTNDQPALPLIAIPTTSGTGSEATHFAVAYAQGVKQSIAAPSMRPGRVILDVRFHLAMPAKLTAVTGLDALTQAIESLWSVGACQKAAEYARQAGPLIANSLESSVTTGDPSARERMMLGAHLAGQAINLSKTTAAHALSYAITQEFGIAHGHAVALILPHVAVANAAITTDDCQHPSGPEHVKQQIAIVTDWLGTEIEDFVPAWHHLLKRIGLPPSLSESDVPRQALAHLAKSVNVERLSNNPRRLSEQDLRMILEQAY